MFLAACDNNSLLSVVGLSSHLVLSPTVCDCPGIWPVAPGSALGGDKPVLEVLGDSMALFFSSLSVHPRLVAVVDSGQCPHWLLLEGVVAAGRNISSLGSLLGQQTCRVPEERSGRSTAKPRKGRAFCLQLHTSEGLTGLQRGFPSSCQSGLGSTMLLGVWNMAD